MPILGFPLSDHDDGNVISSGSDLQESLSHGLGEIGGIFSSSSKKGRREIPPGIISVQGKWPELSRIRVDLSGAKFKLDQLPVHPEIRPRKKKAGPGCREIIILGAPVFLGTSAIHFEMNAFEVGLMMVSDGQGRRWLTMERAKKGSVNFRMEKKDLKRTFLEAARSAAERFHIHLESGDLELKQKSQGAIEVKVDLVLRKLLLRGHLQIRGELMVGKHLNIRFINPSCEGDGMIGKAACAVLTPYLQDWKDPTFARMSLGINELGLSHIQTKLDRNGALHVAADF
jgi:hypothetical protein